MVRGCLCGHPKKTPGSGGGGARRRPRRRKIRQTVASLIPAAALAPGCSASHPIGHAGHAQAQILLGPGWPPVRPQWPYDDREQPWRFRCEAFASILVKPRRCSRHVRQPTSIAWLVASPCILALASAAAAYPDFAGSTPTSTAWASKQGVSTRTSRCRSGQSEGPRS